MSTLELSFQAELKQNIKCLVDGSLPAYYFEKFKQGDFFDIKELAQFLFLAGEYTQLIQFCVLVMEHRKPVTEDTFPWNYLVESIFRIEPFPSNDLKTALMNLHAQLNLDEQFATSPHARKLVHRSEEIFSQWIHTAEDRYDALKADLLNELKQAELEGALRLEDQLIQKLVRIDPTDAAITNYHKKLKERRALEVLSQRKTYDLQYTVSDLEDPQVLQMYTLIRDQMMVAAEEWPVMATDYAVALAQFGEPGDAEKVLELAPAGEEKDWLRCELLLLQHKFIDLLSTLPKIELQYAHDSMTFFHTAYLRAKCYYGLGQKETAVEILDSLTTTRPEYRDASILLSQWRLE